MAHLGLGTLHLNRRGTSLFAKQLLDSIEQIEYVTVIGILVRLWNVFLKFLIRMESRR